MIFNEFHKVIIHSLNEDEASAFIKFLESEIIRHEDDIKQAHELIGEVEKLLREKHGING